MHKIITKTLLLLTLLVLLIGITSAATVSENTTTKVEKDMNTSPQEEVQKSNEKIVEKEIIKKETYKTSNTKEASTNIEVSDFNTLHNTLTKDTYDTVTVNLNLSIL